MRPGRRSCSCRRRHGWRPGPGRALGRAPRLGRERAGCGTTRVASIVLFTGRSRGTVRRFDVSARISPSSDVVLTVGASAGRRRYRARRRGGGGVLGHRWRLWRHDGHFSYGRLRRISRRLLFDDTERRPTPRLEAAPPRAWPATRLAAGSSHHPARSRRSRLDHWGSQPRMFRHSPRPARTPTRPRRHSSRTRGDRRRPQLGRAEKQARLRSASPRAGHGGRQDNRDESAVASDPRSAAGGRLETTSLPFHVGLVSLRHCQLFGSATQRKALPPAPVLGVTATLPTWSVM